MHRIAQTLHSQKTLHTSPLRASKKQPCYEGFLLYNFKFWHVVIMREW